MKCCNIHIGPILFSSLVVYYFYLQEQEQEQEQGWERSNKIIMREDFDSKTLIRNKKLTLPFGTWIHLPPSSSDTILAASVALCFSSFPCWWFSYQFWNYDWKLLIVLWFQSEQIHLHISTDLVPEKEHIMILQSWGVSWMLRAVV